MSPATKKHHSPALSSSLRRIPAELSPRCQRPACLGTDCPSWRHCAPGTPCGGYRAFLSAAPIPVDSAFAVRTPQANRA